MTLFQVSGEIKKNWFGFIFELAQNEDHLLKDLETSTKPNQENQY